MTRRVPISGISKKLRELVRHDASITLILTTPEEDSVDIQLSIETIVNGVTTTENCGMIPQAAVEALLLPEGGAVGAAVAAAVRAITADIVSDFNTAYNAAEVAVIAVTGAGEVAAVTAELASQQTTIAAILTTAVNDIDAALPEEPA